MEFRLQAERFESRKPVLLYKPPSGGNVPPEGGTPYGELHAGNSMRGTPCDSPY
ncbi:MAG: hypothetical protein IPG76_15000 [Acidobacteria bacterium]|nr:hypothetical protein [Acidobacteriota bacterium]